MGQLRNSWCLLLGQGEGSYFHGSYLQEPHQVLQEIYEDPLESLVGGQEKSPGEVHPEAYPMCMCVCASCSVMSDSVAP